MIPRQSANEFQWMFWQRMRLAFRKHPPELCPFRNPRRGRTCASRICAGRCSRGPLQCTRRDRVPRAQSPSSYSLRAGKLECENDAHMLLMNCAQATHEERRTGAILLRPRWRELAPQRIADRDRCRPIIAIRETKHMHMRVPTYASPNAKTTMRRCASSCAH